jgi:hypothetical protein
MQSRTLIVHRAAGIALLLAAVSAGNPASAAEVKTSKERLSDKAADEQRVDNCRVPVERQGSVPRPGCAGETGAPPPATGMSPARPPNGR